MPAKSKAQFKFLQALIHGGLKNKPEGLSKAKAQEYIDKTKSYKALPNKVKSKKKK